MYKEPEDKKDAIETEIKECTEFFKINLEDQQWVELIASFTS